VRKKEEGAQSIRASERERERARERESKRENPYHSVGLQGVLKISCGIKGDVTETLGSLVGVRQQTHARHLASTVGKKFGNFVLGEAVCQMTNERRERRLGRDGLALARTFVAAVAVIAAATTAAVAVIAAATTAAVAVFTAVFVAAATTAAVAVVAAVFVVIVLVVRLVALLAVSPAGGGVVCVAAAVRQRERERERARERESERESARRESARRESARRESARRESGESNKMIKRARSCGTHETGPWRGSQPS
jgi:hypothetical protein